MRARVAIVSAVIALAVATAARANVPAGAFVSVERTIDVASFSRTIATRYDIVVRGALTADIHRAGALDVVASTARGVPASVTAVQRCEALCVFFLPLFSWSAAPRGRMRRR